MSAAKATTATSEYTEDEVIRVYLTGFASGVGTALGNTTLLSKAEAMEAGRVLAARAYHDPAFRHTILDGIRHGMAGGTVQVHTLRLDLGDLGSGGEW